jgi:magnesium transporter
MLILLSFSQNHLELFTSWDVNAVLERIGNSHNIWLRCIQFRDRTAIARIINQFGLKPSRVDMIFNHFPLGIDEDIEELDQPWSYPAVLVVMGLIVIGSIVYAKQQRWL